MNNKIICPICGTENKVHTKHCRICFSRLTEFKTKSYSFKTEFLKDVNRHRRFFSFLFILLLLLIIWILLR